MNYWVILKFCSAGTCNAVRLGGRIQRGTQLNNSSKKPRQKLNSNCKNWPRHMWPTQHNTSFNLISYDSTAQSVSYNCEAGSLLLTGGGEMLFSRYLSIAQFRLVLRINRLCLARSKYEHIKHLFLFKGCRLLWGKFGKACDKHYSWRAQRTRNKNVYAT